MSHCVNATSWPCTRRLHSGSCRRVAAVGPCMHFSPWHKLHKSVMQCRDMFASNLSATRTLLLIPWPAAQTEQSQSCVQVPLYYWCAHFAPESEKKQLNRRWQVQMGVLLVGTGALIVWSMLLGKVNSARLQGATLHIFLVAPICPCKSREICE